MDKINVIIPCYNYASYLDLCLMSVFTQRVDCEIEILFSDDNSSDESFGIAKRIAERYNTDKIYLKVFRQEKNIGEIENTKFLISQCSSKYISYLDADDYWIDPYKLEKQYKFMESNPDFSMCYTGQLGYDGVHHSPDPTGFETLICPYYFITDGILYSDENYSYSYGILDNKTLCNANHVFSSSRFFRNYSDLIKEYFYDFPYSDWPMNFELGLRGKIFYMNFAGYVYRTKSDSLFHKETSEVREEKNQHRCDLLKYLYSKNNDSFEDPTI
jgi:glycosyltransferase involved in cell wall biosynthesis